MTSLEKGNDKIDRICHILRQETIEPAKAEADHIINTAKDHAKTMINKAKQDIEQMMEHARAEIQKEKQLFEATLSQSSQQGLEYLKQALETQLFSGHVVQAVDNALEHPDLIAKMIESIIASIDKGGLSRDFSVILAKEFPKDMLKKYLSREMASRIGEKGFSLGEFHGGIQVKLHDKNITLDISDKSLKELLGKFLRPSFREILFKNV